MIVLLHMYPIFQSM